MPPILLFDIGEVLVKVRGFDFFLEQTGLKLSRTELIDLWNLSPTTAFSETSPIEGMEFATRLVAEWHLDITPEEFLESFRNWTCPPLPLTLDLLRNLRKTHICAAFSNTNSIHWKTLTEDYRLQDHLDQIFASQMMGLRKPDPESFLAVAKGLGAAPEQIVFFDDSQRNIDGARAVGMQAHRVESVEGLPDLIRSLGYL